MGFLELRQEPGVYWLLSTGSHRVRHDGRDLVCVHALEIYITKRINWFKSPMHVTGHAWVKDQKTNMLKKI